MFKKLLVLLLSLSLALSVPFSIYADSPSDYADNKNVSANKNNLKITGSIPVIKNLINPMFQYKLNKAIENVYNEKISAAESKKIHSLNFSYEIIPDTRYISVLIYSTNPSTKQSEVTSFVITKAVNEYASVNSILGSNGISFVNKYVSNKISSDTKTKYFNSASITENTPFYVKNGNITIVYGAGSIAAVSKGVLRFDVPSGNITNLSVSSENYYTKPLYGVKMINLRYAVQSFGYALTWDSKQNKITVSKNGSPITTITIGRNSYSKGKFSPKQLEYAPEIKDGRTYVPISFFEEILGLLASADDKGNITISSYTL